MKRWRGFFTVAVLCFGLLSFATPAAAQETPSDDSGDTPMIGSTDEEISSKLRGGWFVSAAFGSASADPFNTSIRSAEGYETASETEIDEQTFGRASIGWKLPEGKGAFRLSFNGYREDEYTFKSQGLSRGVLNPDGTPQNVNASEVLPWWNLTIKDGQMVAVLSPPVFETTDYAIDPLTGTVILNPDGSCVLRLGGDGLPVQVGDDLNCNNIPDPNEVRYPTSEPAFVRSVPDNLENQLQTIDLTYGRQFGGRRYSSQWQAGVRYFEYEGQVMGGAWLFLGGDGGFSDGSLLRPLRLAQKADGLGPTGSWEVDFNFFNKGLVLFMKATTALTFNNISVDSGNFFTLVNDQTLEWVVASTRLKESRDKSSWQNSGEFGARIHLRNGLEFELGYTINGFLDVVISPFDLTLPETSQQTVDGTSALFTTQDYRMDSFHVGVGFQF